ncbi:MAG TPA: phosphoribosylformylglycinamidine cyclo-ligase, partial [Saprospiraceae bacterium]|nr:phosphoribosylformylglycinamidine cyclo-ligase [Saprospiraceae bacterium]
MDAEKYSKRGVSASKSEIHEAIEKMDKGLFPKAFCKILPDITGGDDAFVNIMHADTAGTKTSLAYIYWKETGDLSVWEGIVQDALVMNLDDMACVGCTDQIIISSTIGRNKHLIPKEVLEVILNASASFIQKMKALGINIYHSGGETADVGDIVRTIDVGFTAFARMRREDLVVNNIKPGDAIIGFASFGQAGYEDQYNGGMGSNGLTSARHDVFSKIYQNKYPESFDPKTDKTFIYSGTKKLTDKIDTGSVEIEAGKLVLSPTRTYLPLLNKILRFHRKNIHGIIHNTGGAQTKVLKFVENCTIIKDNLFPVPPLFRLIQNESGTDWNEMYKVFNMGHRLEIYIEPQFGKELLQIASEMNIESRIIGRVEKGVGNRLI